jgi:signal transduction histidine kinase/CheY-like chemotaxis protein
MKAVILVIDDQPIMAKALKIQLEQIIDAENYQVESCIEVEQAFEIIHKAKETGEEIPLIICDFIMPTMDGAEFIKKAHEILPSTLKVLLSAQVDLDEIAGFIDYESMYKFVKKPWNKIDLGTLVNSALNTYHNRDDIKNKELIHVKDELLFELSELLENKRHKLQLAFESCKFYLWEWNIEDDTITYDGFFIDLLGYDKSTITNRESLLSIIYEEDKPKVILELHKMIAGKSDQINIKCRLKAKNNDYIWVETRGVLVLSDTGKRVVSAVTQDIDSSERNQLKIEENEFLFRTFFNKMSSGAIIGHLILDKETDTIIDLECIDINSYAEGFFEKDKSQLIGCLIKDLLNEYITPKFYDFLNLIYKTQEVHFIQSSFLINNKHIDLYGFPFPNAKDKIAFIFNDMTERYNREQHIQKAKIEADENVRMKNAFIANMSHEIRTPMSQIIGFAELLKDSSFEPEERAQFSDIIVKKSHQMMKLLNDIVDISKIEANQIKLSKADISINSIMLELNYIYIDYLNDIGKDLKLICNTPLSDDQIIYYTDSVRFKQIMSNLIENAIKYTNEGFVEFGYELSESLPRFYVKDTGIGIAADNIDKIFLAFEQADTSYTRNYEGAGLGLSICNLLTIMLGGNLLVESELGKGSKFYFSLPAEHSTNTTTKTLAMDIMPFKLENKDFVFISNSKDEIYYLQKLAELNRFTIHNAKDKNAVLDLIGNTKIDILIIDLIFLETEYAELMNNVKQVDNNIKIIALTSVSNRTTKDKLISLGFNGVLIKPYDQNDFFMLVTSLIYQ